MIIVDNALKAREAEGKPIRVGMVGAGFMGQGLTNQITHSVPGMRMAAVYNRRPERAHHVYRYAGLEEVVVAATQPRQLGKISFEQKRIDCPFTVSDSLST